MPIGERGSCFFCLTRPGPIIVGIKAPDEWPGPIPQETFLRCCDLCLEKSDDEKTAAVVEFANDLKKIQVDEEAAERTARADHENRLQAIRDKAAARPPETQQRGKLPKALVYFIGPCDGGSIKIGCTTDVKNRLASLRTSSAVPLKIIATMGGGYDLESNLHSRFKSFRAHGEWFTPAQPLLDFIRDHATPWEG